jgi:hypothetical protein
MTSLNLQRCQTNELLYVGFNQDFGSCGAETCLSLGASPPSDGVGGVCCSELPFPTTP